MNAADERARAQARNATTVVFDVLLQQYSIDDRIAILTASWDRTVKPALTHEAAQQKLKAFGVPFPKDVKL